MNMITENVDIDVHGEGEGLRDVYIPQNLKITLDWPPKNFETTPFPHLINLDVVEDTFYSLQDKSTKNLLIYYLRTG